jgi:lactate dehydrogenase-like 2-hydroxyacid dehydrogenase
MLFLRDLSVPFIDGTGMAQTHGTIMITITIVDADAIAPDVDFPPLKAAKYRWSQFPRLSGDGFADTCWGANVIVTAATPLDAALLEQLPRLRLIIVAGNAEKLVDSDAARSYGIEIECVPDTADVSAACRQITDIIDAFIERSESADNR